jgi:hypothetical protein
MWDRRSGPLLSLHRHEWCRLRRRRKNKGENQEDSGAYNSKARQLCNFSPDNVFVISATDQSVAGFSVVLAKENAAFDASVKEEVAPRHSRLGRR